MKEKAVGTFLMKTLNRLDHTRSTIFGAYTISADIAGSVASISEKLGTALCDESLLKFRKT